MTQTKDTHGHIDTHKQLEILKQDELKTQFTHRISQKQWCKKITHILTQLYK